MSDPPAEADPPRPKRVLILTASVGAGHNSVAKALRAELTSRRDDLDLQTVDVIEEAHWFFRLYYAGGFVLCMTRLPWGYGAGFWAANRPHRPGRGLSEYPRLWFEGAFLRRLAGKIAGFDPDLIVNTHYVQAPVVRRLQKAGRIRAPQVTVITDVEMHRWWYAREVLHWYAPSEYNAERLRQWGIDEDRITVSGIPIHPKWDRNLQRTRILEDWSLPADKRIFLLSGGTEFTVGPVARIAADLAKACPEAFVVVLAGRNKKLLARLSRLAGGQPRIRPQGFTDRINELVEVTDLMITKPGGITTAECLSKGCPMLLINPVPGQEGGNAKYFARQGAAVIARGRRRIVRAAVDLLSRPDKLREMADRAGELYRPGREIAVDGICRILDGLPA